MSPLIRSLAISFWLSSPLSGQTFSEPGALKVGWNAQALYLGDIDQDGRRDLAIIDNTRSRIDLRFGLKKGEVATPTERSVQNDRWEPLLEDSPYQKAWVTTGVSAYDLSFADLNGDGLPDMIYTSDRDELIVHFQLEDRKWDKLTNTRLRSLKNNWTSLDTADLDADGDQDVVILGEEYLVILKNEGHGTFKNPTYYLCGENAFGLKIVDINRDKHLDIAYQDSEVDELYVRLQQNGDFPVQQIVGVDSPAIMVGFPQGGQNEIVSLSNETRAMEKYVVQAKANDFKKGDISLFSYSLGETKGDFLQHSRVDLDLDGDLDLIVSDEKSASLRVYLEDKNGRFALPVESPTVHGIKSLAVADLKPGGNLEAVIYSEAENIIGIIEFDSAGQASFPIEIPFKDQPTVVTAGDLNQDGRSEVIFTSADALHISKWSDDKWITTTTKLEDIGSDRLENILLFDINQDGRRDLLFILQRDPMKMLLQQEDGTLIPADDQSGFSKKLTERIPSTAISPGDLDSDGKAELLITRDSLLRGIRLGKNGQLEVVKQINISKKELSLAAGIMVNVTSSEKPELALFDEKESELLICDLNGEIISRKDLILGDFAALSGDKNDLLLFGSGQFIRVPLTRKLLQANRTKDYQTTLKRVTYFDFRIGDLNGDQRDDIVVIDSNRSHVLEILLTTDTGWRSQQHFVIFESDRHFRGKKGGDFQPRDFQIRDMNGDGKNDLVLFIHDRILTYLQQ